MSVTPPSDGKGLEYLFERTSEHGDRYDSGWVTSTSYRDRQLLPNSSYRYRVKARNRYLQESQWTPVESVRTGNMPAPVIWELGEGKGKRIADTRGRHTGRVLGTADWVTDRLGSSLRLDGQASVIMDDVHDFPTSGDFTWTAWIKSRRGGTIVVRQVEPKSGKRVAKCFSWRKVTWCLTSVG